MVKKYVTSTGREHGLVNTQANSSKDNDFAHFSPEMKERAKKEKADDAKIKKVQFLHKDGAGKYIKKPYCRWAGEDIQEYIFIHGYEYEVPNGLVKEINDPNIRRKKRSDLLDANNRPLVSDQIEEPDFRFVGLI